ncbi:hypothetical protein FRC11_008736 [Ceratobasidium sp. 423]|nr:hypothetical protein FRC11_008736 [Ceratobasidium sp. 423]
MPVMAGKEVWGKPWEEIAQPLGAEPGASSLMFYPNPEHAVAETPTTTAVASYIIREHGTERFVDTVKSFMKNKLMMIQHSTYGPGPDYSTLHPPVVQADMNAALEERVATGKAKQEKSTTRQGTIKSKLTGVRLKQHATYDELFNMKISDLDLQIDKLREAGDKHVHPKSTLQNKDTKVKEILAGLERRRSLGITVVADTQSHENMESESAEPVLPEDMELYHPDEVVF